MCSPAEHHLKLSPTMTVPNRRTSTSKKHFTIFASYVGKLLTLGLTPVGKWFILRASMSKDDVIPTLNIEIERLPVETKRIIDTLRKLRGMTLKATIVEALNEYAANHRKDIASLV